MKCLILGTAGHVDHGKTALVEALTGTNTDRWEEEHRRGITIDLGFANLPTGSAELEISVVDVPGHEDFVKNMLAGATGVDLLLLVVAADEGPMPQTREHLWIARLLGARRGLVALSKSDLVDADWLDLVRDSVRDELQRVFGASDWPIIAVSAVTGAGLNELSEALLAAAREATARTDDDLFRLPVDRSFSVRGVGTVVTGTVWSGRVESGEEIIILPAGRSARLRGLQVHGRDVNVAKAGQRAALALVGVDRGDVTRGDLLTSHAIWRSSQFLDVRLEVIPDASRPLRHWQRVRFHLGTAETLARVVLPQAAVAPGGQASAQLRLETPVVARAGDRFVLRFYSPVTTIGGGVVIDPWAERRTPPRVAALGEVHAAGLEERIAKVVAARAEGADAPELAILVGAPPAQIDSALQALAASGSLQELAGRWYPRELITATSERLVEFITAGHARDLGARGVSLESLRSAVGGPSAVVNAALEDLEREGVIRVVGSLAALVSHVPQLLPEQQRLADEAAKRIRQANLSPPSLKELASQLRVREDELIPVLKFLAEQGSVVAVTADLYFDSGAIRDVRSRVGRRLAGGQLATPSELRQMLDVSRKYAIPLLEHLDAIGFTQRTPEGRVLREVD